MMVLVGRMRHRSHYKDNGWTSWNREEGIFDEIYICIHDCSKFGMFERMGLYLGGLALE